MRFKFLKLLSCILCCTLIGILIILQNIKTVDHMDPVFILQNDVTRQVSTKMFEITERLESLEDIQYTGSMTKTLSLEDVISELRSNEFPNLSERELLEYYNPPSINKYINMTYKKTDMKILKSLFPATLQETVKPKQNNDRIIDQLNLKLNNTVPKIIVIWNPDIGLTNSLEENKCLIDRCRFTDNKEELKNADAVVFNDIPFVLKKTKNSPKSSMDILSTRICEL